MDKEDYNELDVFYKDWDFSTKIKLIYLFLGFLGLLGMNLSMSVVEWNPSLQEIFFEPGEYDTNTGVWNLWAGSTISTVFTVEAHLPGVDPNLLTIESAYLIADGIPFPLTNMGWNSVDEMFVFYATDLDLPIGVYDGLVAITTNVQTISMTLKRP